MKGWLIYIDWCPHDSYFWIPEGEYSSARLAAKLAWITGGNTWIFSNDSTKEDYGLTSWSKRRINIWNYSVEIINLCEKD